METVSIRRLRGAHLREMASKGKLLGITNHRVIIGVVIPVAAAWVEHLIDYNWSHVRQSIYEGEQAMAVGVKLTTLDDVTDEADVADGTPEEPALAAPLPLAVVEGEVTQTPESREILKQLHSVLNPGRAPREAAAGPEEPTVRSVRIGDLGAEVIEKAGAAGQALAITHDRELIGILIPVTQGLVQFLLEQNMSRVLYNIGLGEKRLSSGDSLTTLDDILGRGAPAKADHPPHPAAPGTQRKKAARPG